jgi:uncharacterized protein
MRLLHLGRAALVQCLLWLTASLAQAQAPQPVPALSGRVLDLAQVLSASEQAALTQQLADVEQTLGAQIVVVLVGSTQPEDIADYTQRLGDAWKIGRRDVGDGLLIVAAVQDRRVRIAPAKSLEGALPDLKAKQIIDRAIVPHFKQGQWALGLGAALGEIQVALTQAQLPSPQAASTTLGGASPPFFETLIDGAVLLLMVIPVACAILMRALGKRLGLLAGAAVGGGVGWLATGSLVIAVLASLGAFVIGAFSSLRGYGPTTPSGAWSRRGRQGGAAWPGMDGGHRAGGSWGGGGFSSGGGGNFGGGGASGNW